MVVLEEDTEGQVQPLPTCVVRIPLYDQSPTDRGTDGVARGSEVGVVRPPGVSSFRQVGLVTCGRTVTRVSTPVVVALVSGPSDYRDTPYGRAVSRRRPFLPLLVGYPPLRLCSLRLNFPRPRPRLLFFPSSPLSRGLLPLTP